MEFFLKQMLSVISIKINKKEIRSNFMQIFNFRYRNPIIAKTLLANIRLANIRLANTH